MASPALAGRDEEDPEYGSVYGRIRYLEGSLTLERAGEGSVTDGAVNDPVTPGDRLTTEDGRAEVSLADGSVVWLDSDTRVSLRNLADMDNRYEKTNLIALESGAIRVDTDDPENRDQTFRIDTEAGSIYLLSGGSFRIENEEGATTVYSFRGVAELSGDEDSVLVRTGERSSVQPGRLPSEPRRFNTARLDDFDRFVDSRQEAFLRRGGDSQDVPQDVPYEVRPYMSELSYYGSWRMVPSYGWVWRPAYAGSWGPYVNGYWNWCRGSWVWVSYDPWGWAPYHYGRWDFAVDIGWVWIPGRVWSGAWVSFAVGPSYVGWCPLNYYNRPVFHDVTIINATYINVNHLRPRGWRFVSTDRFEERRPGRSFVRADRLPRGTEVVLTSRLPRFDSKEAGRRPDQGERLMEQVRRDRTPLPAAVDRESRPVSFRTIEKDSEPRSRRGNTPRDQALPRGRSRTQDQDKPRGQDNPKGQVRPRPERGQSADRPRRPDSDDSMRAPAPGPSTSVRPPRRPAAPGRVQEPRQVQPNRQGSRPPDSQAHPRRESAPPAGAGEAPRRESRPADPGRPGARSDQKIERLFDGVRGDRNRGRAEPQRVQPNRIGPPAPGRPGMEGPRPERPPSPRPSAPPRAQKPPKDNPKGNGGDHRH